MKIEEVKIHKPNDVEIIIGQGTFNLLAIEQIHTCIASSNPSAKFGVAFNEGSDNKLIRTSGNAEDLVDIAHNNIARIGCGHVFFIALRHSYPIQVLNSIKNLQTVVNVIGATGNTCSVVVANTDEGKGLLGIIDGSKPSRVENGTERKQRKSILKKIGYVSD